MKRSAFAVYRRIHLVTGWYGSAFDFYRKPLNAYGEPEGDPVFVQRLNGIYHSTSRDFVELINTEGTSVKSKVNKGILCTKDIKPAIQQGDFVDIHGSEYYVTAVEPVLYSDEVIAYEVSVEEFVEGVEVL